MNILEIIGAVLGLPVLVLGIIGGLLTLPARIRKFRRDRQQHGTKGMGFCVLSRSDQSDGITVKFLVVEDLIQFVCNFAKPETKGIVKAIQAVGAYYEVTMEFPPGMDLHFSVAKRK